MQENPDESDIDTAPSPEQRTVFIDCEFTDLVDPELISIGLVCDDGRELYISSPVTGPVNVSLERLTGLLLLLHLPAACALFGTRIPASRIADVLLQQCKHRVRRRGQRALPALDQTD